MNGHILELRAWQKKLHALVKDSQMRAEVYACLWMLMNEEYVERFLERQQLFISYWTGQLPRFIEYYENTYRSRAGTYIK